MTNETHTKSFSHLDADGARCLLKTLECPIGSITSELETSVHQKEVFPNGGGYFNAHYVLNNIRDARRALDKIEAQCKEHQANGNH
jgi:hypothetical protein